MIRKFEDLRSGNPLWWKAYEQVDADKAKSLSKNGGRHYTYDGELKVVLFFIGHIGYMWIGAPHEKFPIDPTRSV